MPVPNSDHDNAAAAAAADDDDDDAVQHLNLRSFSHRRRCQVDTYSGHGRYPAPRI